MSVPEPIDPYAVLKRCQHMRDNKIALTYMEASAEALARVAIHLREVAEAEEDAEWCDTASEVLRLIGGAS